MSGGEELNPTPGLLANLITLIHGGLTFDNPIQGWGRVLPRGGFRKRVRNSGVHGKDWKRDKWLLLIGIAKVFKAVLLIALGIGAVRLLQGDIGENVERWCRRLNVDAWNPWFQTFPEKVKSVSPHKMGLLCAGAFVYSGLFLTEGTGLLLRKRWGEFVTIFITSSFLPFEIYELAAKEFSVFKLLVLIANVVVVVYLVWRVKREKA